VAGTIWYHCVCDCLNTMTTVSALATTTATPSDSKVAGAASPSNLTATTAGASDPDVIGAPSSAHPTAPAAASSLGHGHGDGNGNAHGNGKAHGNGNGNDSPNDAFTHPPLTKTFSPATEEILKRLPQTSVAAVRGSQEWEAAREAVLKTMTTSSSTDLPATSLHDHAPTVKVEATPNIMDSSTSAIRGDTRGRNRGGRPRGRGRGRGRGALALAVSTTSPSSTPVRGRGRGGRPRGRAGRGGRKPLSEGIKIHEVSSDSDADDVLYDAENTRLATTSRSGRAITKPINFVPVIPSPTSGVKRKRYWGRRNPELAVCKACLRPHSPASNMIVFCDGCNTPYHRYCHHPPISQDVVDVPDMEWFCADCTVRPVPDVDVDTFVAGSHLSEDQVRRLRWRHVQRWLLTVIETPSSESASNDSVGRVDTTCRRGKCRPWTVSTRSSQDTTT
jgi:hypothetical protein